MTVRTSRSLILAVLALAVSASPALAVRHAQTSTNWAGYVASGAGVAMRHVSGTWVMPTATCPGGSRSYEATWVGLGGYHTTSTALEQIGTESDCTRSGTATYSVWYELVPAESVAIHLAIHPGDLVSASVGVNGSLVRLRIADVTQGTVFTRVARASAIDVTSADWIVEAPSACTTSGCTGLPLANFGTEEFTQAGATTSAGVRGVISNPGWTPSAIALSAGSRRPGTHGASTSAATSQATPGELSATGDGFTVSYGLGATTTPPDLSLPASSASPGV
jgi:hypothetical protein